MTPGTGSINISLKNQKEWLSCQETANSFSDNKKYMEEFSYQ